MIAKSKKDKIRKYYLLKKRADELAKKVEELKQEIKEDPNIPYGHFQFYNLDVVIDETTRLQYDYKAMVKALGKKAEKFRRNNDYVILKVIPTKKSA